MAAKVAGVLFFLLLYYTPFLLDSSNFLINDSGASVLLNEALQTRAVQLDLLSNLLGHLLPLMACYLAVVWMAHHSARVIGCSSAYMRWLMVLMIWLALMIGNRILFPLSDYSIPFDAIAKPVTLGSLIFILTVVILCATVKTVHLHTIVAGFCVAALFGAMVAASRSHDNVTSTQGGVRNVVIIGVDSLAPKYLDDVRAPMPLLASLMGHGQRYERAYTPLARTFPAWMSLLSGYTPAEHGAIFNLRQMDRTSHGALLTHKLRQNGYKTFFAMDERRFSNIDESFGFDKIIGPKIGALDFVLQRVNDTPLTNLLLQTKISHYLFPFSRFNTASPANYDADGFVDEILGVTSSTGPLFLATHFESAHFPFKNRHTTRLFDDSNHFIAGYLAALSVVDGQIRRLMDGLRAQRRLDDALVIVLSDHGESLGEEEMHTTQGGAAMTVQGYGHGASLLSEEQNRVVLGAVQFRNGQPVGPVIRHAHQVSLMDVRAAIEEYVATGDVKSMGEHTTCMTVETGLRLNAAASYEGLAPEKVATEAASYYEIDSAGRMRLRESQLAALVDLKDVGWRCQDQLTYYSSVKKRYFAYRVIDAGKTLIETKPISQDIARVEAYRALLRQSAGG